MADPSIYYGFSTCDVFWISRDVKNDPKQVAKSAADIFKLVYQPDTGVPTLSSGRWLNSADGWSDVIQCTWTKNTTDPAGVFNMVLKPGWDYANEKRGIRPGDVLVIFMSSKKPTAQLGPTGEIDMMSKPKGLTLVTLGLVDRVAEARSAGTKGESTINVIVTGRDFGKMLQETQTVFDPAWAFDENNLFAISMDRMRNQLEAGAFSPVEMVLKIFDAYFNDGTMRNKAAGAQWRFPGTDKALARLVDTKSFVQAPMFGYTMPDMIALDQAGNVWNLLDAHANRVVNEMFIDVRDLSKEEDTFRAYQEDVASSFVDSADVPVQVAARQKVYDGLRSGPVTWSSDKDQGYHNVVALVFRQTPYDYEAFQRLPTTNVDETEVYETNLGRSSHEVINFIRLRTMEITPDCQEWNYGIFANFGSLMTHGIRRLEAETRYGRASSQLVPPEVGVAPPVSQGVRRIPVDDKRIYDYYVGLLATWNTYNDLLYSGTISMRFRPEIRCGTRIVFSFSNLEHRTYQGAGERPAPAKSFIEFYVQGVQHTFSFEPGTSRTTLTVVRGIRSSDVEIMKGTLPPAAQLRWTKRGMTYSSEIGCPWHRYTSERSFMVAGVDDREAPRFVQSIQEVVPK